MLTSISFKIATLASFVLLASASCNLCKSQSAKYEAAKDQIKIVAPLNAAQSKAELQSRICWTAAVCQDETIHF